MDKFYWDLVRCQDFDFEAISDCRRNLQIVNGTFGHLVQKKLKKKC